MSSEPTDVQLIDTLKQMKAETTSLESRINNLAQEESEHKYRLAILLIAFLIFTF